MVRPNSANAKYASIVSATATSSAIPVDDTMIGMGFNTIHGTAVDITPDLSVPSKG